MKNYIPVQNSLDKALAFAPSLRADYFQRVHMHRPAGHINTIDTIEKLQGEGWFLQAVTEQRGSSRKVESNQVRMYHPDLAMVKPNGDQEGTSNLYVSNSLMMNNMELALGFYRLVCSNGAVAYTGDRYKIKRHDDIEQHLNKIERDALEMIKDFDRLKEIELSSDVQKTLAAKALDIRFGGMMARELDYRQLLKVNRPEDEGNNVWAVFNRIQEGIIKPNMLTTKNGTPLNGVYDPAQNVMINQKLHANIVMPFTTVK